MYATQYYYNTTFNIIRRVCMLHTPHYIHRRHQPHYIGAHEGGDDGRVLRGYHLRG